MLVLDAHFDPMEQMSSNIEIMGSLLFDLLQFNADRSEALAAHRSQKYVREVVARAVSDPAAVPAALGEPQRAGLQAGQ